MGSKSSNNERHATIFHTDNGPCPVPGAMDTATDPQQQWIRTKTRDIVPPSEHKNTHVTGADEIFGLNGHHEKVPSRSNRERGALFQPTWYCSAETTNIRDTEHI